MRSFHLFGKEVYFHPADLLFFILVFSYLFYTYSPWLTDHCIATVTADVNHHIAHYTSFIQHLKTNHGWYPVDYTRDNDGFYWYFVLPLPYILPWILSFFFSANFAFFLFYILAYCFLILGFYLFLLNFCQRPIAQLLCAFLVVGPFLNLIFSVGGNYHFFIGLTFFIYTLHYFYRFTLTNEKKYLFLCTLFFLLLGSTYYFSLLFFLAFAIVYLVIKRNFRMLTYFFFLGLVLSVYLLPTTIQTLTFEEKNPPTSMAQILTTHVLPKYGLTSWLYMKSPPYDSTRDQNHGPHMYILGILSLLLLLFFYRERTHAYSFLLLYFLVILFFFLFPSTTKIIPSERLMVHFYTAFFFLFAYALNKIKLHIYTLLAVLLFSTYFIPSPFLRSQFFFFLILLIPLLFSLWKKDPAFSFMKHDYFMIGLHLLFFFLLIFPLTGSVEGTTLMPRTNFFSIDAIHTAVYPQDVLAYQGGFTLGYPLLSCAYSTGVLPGGASRDRDISKQDEIDFFNSSQFMRDLIAFKDITKIVIPVEIIQNNGKINIAKIQHLLNWYGNPAVVTAFFRMYDHGRLLQEIPYPLLVFHAQPPQPPYTLTTITPIHLQVTNAHHLDRFMINIQYNAWWHAFADGKEIPIINRGGYITFANIQNIPVIDLRFSMFWFYLGRIFSIIALVIVVLFYRHYEDVPGSWKKNAWLSFFKKITGKQ